jgi:hypothetical protein
MVRAFSCGGSFQGNTVISAFGQSRSYVDGCLERVRRDVVRQDKHRPLARARKIARHALHEVGPQAVEVVQVFLDGLHRHVGAPLAKLLGPDILAGVVHIVGALRPMPDRLAWGALHQLHRERAADAVAHEKELADAEVVYQTQLVAGEAPQGSSTGIGPVDSLHTRSNRRPCRLSEAGTSEGDSMGREFGDNKPRRNTIPKVQQRSARLA